MELEGKHALVCGASGGIGRATALALARRGARVTGLARSADKLADLVPELKAAGAPEAFALVADLDKRPDVAGVVRTHLDQHGPVHILVNNSGGPPPGRLLDVDDEDAFTVPFGRHVLASHMLVRMLLPGMEKAGYGRIINIISTSVREPIPNLGVSNVVRGAMASWAKTLSRELPPGVTINSVLPGYTDTERLASLRSQLASSQDKTEHDIDAMWVGKTPEGRLGRPEELAAAVAFLAGPEAGFVRGIVLPVDGGRLGSI